MGLLRIFFVISIIMLSMVSCAEKNDITSNSTEEIQAEEIQAGGSDSTKPLRVNIYTPEGGGTLLRWKGYEYNTDGTVSKIIQHEGNSDLVMSWEEYGYDSGGNQIKLSFYNGPGSYLGEGEYKEEDALTGWREFQYDGDGYLVKRVNYIAGGSIDMYTEYLHDANGNTVKETEYSVYEEEGLLIGWYTYEYNEGGLKTQSSYYRADGSILYNTGYGYFGQKNVDDSYEEVTKQYNGDGEIEDTIVYTYSNYYGDNGQLIKETFASDGEVVNWQEYVY
ncbi:MAG: hypothetical protein LBV08_08005 [Clostridiales bacterium]|jgi:hypothetical protein|nr:hypothetical protein [Clostridiales bacterium]